MGFRETIPDSYILLCSPSDERFSRDVPLSILIGCHPSSFYSVGERPVSICRITTIKKYKTKRSKEVGDARCNPVDKKILHLVCKNTHMRVRIRPKSNVSTVSEIKHGSGALTT